MYPQNTDAPLALLLGRDDLLRRTRAWLLSTVGYKSIFAFSVREFQETSLAEPVCLIVVCQTLSVAECAAVEDFAAEHVPHARLIVFFDRRLPFQMNGTGVVLDVKAGPEVFVKAAKRMLASQSSLPLH